KVEASPPTNLSSFNQLLRIRGAAQETENNALREYLRSLTSILGYNAMTYKEHSKDYNLHFCLIFQLII
ncbi:hypothetical protein FRX31_025340, partial [Thalictrum thalictroides]